MIHKDKSQSVDPGKEEKIPSTDTWCHFLLLHTLSSTFFGRDTRCGRCSMAIITFFWNM